MASFAGVSTLNRRAAVRLGSGSVVAALGMRGQQAAAFEVASLEGNKALAHRLFDEAINGRNVAVLDELFAADFVDRGTWSRKMPGPAGMPVSLEELNALYPDVYVTVEAAVAEGDFVATRETWRGTHLPAGTHVVGRTMHFFRISHGQIVDSWSTGWEWIEALRGRNTSANPLIGS